VITAVNNSDKTIKFSKDFSKSNISNLVLLNARSKNDKFIKKSTFELNEYKLSILNDKIWS
jgi:hypothetical protein